MHIILMWFLNSVFFTHLARVFVLLAARAQESRVQLERSTESRGSQTLDAPLAIPQRHRYLLEHARVPRQVEALRTPSGYLTTSPSVARRHGVRRRFHRQTNRTHVVGDRYRGARHCNHRDVVVHVGRWILRVDHNAGHGSFDMWPRLHVSVDVPIA
jgi:hypothetical protein